MMNYPRVAPLFSLPALCSALAAAAVLVGCGGGGDSGPVTPVTSGGKNTNDFPGGYAQATQLAASCAAPRTGINPLTNQPYPDRQGSLLDEQKWLAAWTHDSYLWFDEVDYGNPASFPTTLSYFETLKTPRLSPTGKAKDNFHFTYATPAWQAAMASEDIGYGATWVVPSATPPRRIVVAYTDPNTPATAAGVALVRGTRVLRIDGVDAVNDATPAGVATLNAALLPTKAGESHQFVVRDPGATADRTVTLVSGAFTASPVQSVRTLANGTVGYMLFNDHTAVSEPALIDAVNRLQAAQVSDLVLDIRYNGGGLLAIASELSYMVAGPARTSGKHFDRTAFNRQYPTVNPVTRAANAPMPFYSTAAGYSTVAERTPLPTLNLGRVYVLTGPDTCSASEAIINGLRGVGVDVIQIGGTTCGKPYGFYPSENCGTTYFSIQFKSENALGFGDYSDGFAPRNGNTANLAASAILPGCSVPDDLMHNLGDPAEARLAAALQHRRDGSCPAVAAAAAAGPGSGERIQSGGEPAAAALAVADGHVVKKEVLMNRILGR